MSYKIKLLKNKKPDIEAIKFTCDEKICESLDQWPMVRDNFNKYNTTVICGRQGSGKTNLTINIIKKIYKKKFHKIYIFMPESSRNSMKEKLFDKLPGEQMFEELTHESIVNLHEEIKRNSMDGLKSLVIYDDVQRSLKDWDTLQKLKEMIANQRHIKLVNIILVQNFYMIDKSLREILNNVIFFKMDKNQTEKIFNDMVELHKDKFELIRDLVFDKPYEWCMISKTNQRIYKGFDEILIEEEEDENEIEIKEEKIKNTKK